MFGATETKKATNPVASVNLTAQLTEIISYLVEAEKKFVGNKVNESFSKFENEIGKTKEDLKALVSTLDGLDFKEDGKIDPVVITSKVADLEANVKVITSKMGDMEKLAKSFEDMGNTSKLISELSIIKGIVDEIKNHSLLGLNDRVQNLEGQVETLAKNFKDLALDVDTIKGKINKGFF